jgi:hypothetical protein
MRQAEQFEMRKAAGVAGGLSLSTSSAESAAP